MFKRDDSDTPTPAGNGKVADLRIPPMMEWVIRRRSEHGGDIVVKGHFLALAKGGVLRVVELSLAPSQETAEPTFHQSCKYLFKKWTDAEQIDIPATPTFH